MRPSHQLVRQLDVASFAGRPRLHPWTESGRGSLRRARRTTLLVLAALGVLALAGCGGGDDEGTGVTLTPEAVEGRDVATERGCMTCHSETDRSSIGPPWKGLYGSEVELDDGTVVIADDAYLTRAVEDPGAEVVAGYNSVMPQVQLDEDEMAAILVYLQELSD